MCLILLNTVNEIRIAKKDITCYKLMLKGDRSIIMHHLYEPNVLQPEVKLNVLLNLTCGRKIEDGYHAYLTRKAAENNKNYYDYDYIAKFIIPKGSEYAIGKGKEITGSQIIMIK